MAMKQVDVAALWGSYGLLAALKQQVVPRSKRKLLLSSYIWDLRYLPTTKKRLLARALHLAAHLARGLVFMTHEQGAQAREYLPSTIPILRLRCGIDTTFYRQESTWSDVPAEHVAMTQSLLRAPYAIMPGDELRCDADALEIVARSSVRLVRICQYSKGSAARLRREALTRGCADRLFVFEGIPYRFVRFLLQNASAYAGLVDSRWQPAGWTVACESIASGLPIAIYEGLVSRELDRLGFRSAMSAVPMNDSVTFARNLEELLATNRDEKAVRSNRQFAASHLDMESSGAEFARQVETTLVQGA